MEQELINKMIDLCLIYDIKESKLYLKALDNQIKVYRNHIEFLGITKPYFFQKEKLKQHNKEIEIYENKIFESYEKISKEIDYVMNLKSFNEEGDL